MRPLQYLIPLLVATADLSKSDARSYDHLDYPTIDKLIRKSGPGTRFVVPLGLKVWFIGCKVPEDQIVEMDWWDESTFQPEEMYEASESAGVASTSDVKGKGKATPEDATAEEAAKVTAISQSLEAFESDEDTDDEKHGLGSGFASLNKLGSLRISCVPAQHNSARTGLDKCTTLWAGFVIEQFACKPSPAPSRTTVYFAGCVLDTMSASRLCLLVVSQSCYTAPA